MGQSLERSRPPIRRRRGRALAGGCCLAVLVVCGLVVFGLQHALNSAHNLTASPPMPDVSAVARSVAVNDADSNATNSLDDQITRLRQLLPWIHPVARKVDDYCGSQAQVPNGIHFVSRTSWGPIECDRTVTWYGSFDGPLAGQLSRIDEAMRRAGMKPNGTPISQLYTLDHGRSPTVNSAYGSYDAPGTDDQGPGVGVIVTAPSALQGFNLDGRAALAPPSPAPTASPTGALVFRALTQVSAVELTAGVSPHAYLIGLTVEMTPYYTAPASDLFSAPATQSGYGCVTGSTCVGG